MNIDDDTTAEIALALLSLSLFKDGPFMRAWKGIDWDIANQLHRRDWILNPVGKSKSVIFTEQGLAEAERFKAKYLVCAQTDTELLVGFEHGLWQSEKRYDEKWLLGHLHPDFTEIGRSGATYGFEDMFPVEAGVIDCLLPLPNLQVVFLSAAMALITYESHVKINDETFSSHRTSMWITDGKAWLLRYHQGTPFNAIADGD